MSESHWTVGELARDAGCKSETVHYYERAGLLPEPPRSAGGHRQYRREHLKRLNFIRRSRELGFSLAEVRELLQLVDEPDHRCEEMQGALLRHAEEVRQKITDLRRLERALKVMAADCGGGAAEMTQCPIVEALYQTRNDAGLPSAD